MAYLFVDTTSNLKIGILSEKYQWICIHNLEVKKPSEVIHRLIYDSLLEHGLTIKSITKVITCAGPGSYTGMRLSEGIVQVLELAGVSATSFYHFDLPQLLGFNKYIWVASAFKGEFFIYQYNFGKVVKKLVLKDNLADELLLFKDFEKFALLPDSNGLYEYKCTSEEIVNNPEKYISKVIERNQRDQAYYYREIEEEFKIK